MKKGLTNQKGTMVIIECNDLQMYSGDTVHLMYFL